ncbi:DUF4430 domain-containing protein [Paenibacillus sp. NPDC058071]|uniref:DUF4430 domain-containing protein n=1 Tax=Paenibacillus sp. NPDC058071 TaxID=3346326 RepID=UPI0036DDABFB
MSKINKKWLAAVVIAAVLAIAFFWGGNNGKPSQPPAGDGTPVAAVSDTPQPTGDAASAASETPPAVSEKEPEADIETTTPPSETPSPSPSDDGSANDPTDDPGTPSAKPGTDGTKEAIGKPSPTPKPEQKERPAEGKPAQPTDKPSKSDGSGSKGKDKYQTDPIPEGKPKPVEWQDTKVDKKKKLTATLSVSAASILDHMDQFNKDKLEVLPEDGIIYKTQKVTFYEGESVFDVLLREMKKNKIHMEFEMTPIYNSNYIEGINNIYEFDCGELSGWMFKVNGWFPNYGSSRYALKDGDVIEWVYTCDLGRDVGGYVASGG